MLTRYIIYGLAGWCIEVFWTGIGSFLRGDVELRGWTYLWMFPIYGLAIVLEPLHNQMRTWPIILRGGVYTLFIFAIEYSTGWFLKTTINTCPWDYSQSSLSVYGFIRLDYAPAWFIVGLLFERLHDFLVKLQLW